MTTVTNVNWKALRKHPGRHAAGDGLFLKVLDEQRSYWTCRYRANGKAREASFGSAYKLDLAGARDRHLALRHTVRNDKRDPVADKRADKHARPGASAAIIPTFGAMADAYIAAHEASWRNPKHREQWIMTLSKYCAPIRSSPVDKIDAKAVLSVLSPIWNETPVTASRLRGRIERVWASAQVAGHIDPDRPNPARWKGWLDHMLANPKKIGERAGHAAMPYADVPAFFAKLEDTPGAAAKALAFTILTCARTSEVMGMTFDEIDGVDGDRPAWIVAAARMKMGKAHHVPLSASAVAILREMIASRTVSRSGGHPFVFPGRSPRRPLSNMAFLMLMRRFGVGEFTAHGFRSAARSWMADHAIAFEVAEACLAHAVGNAVVQAYQRSAMVERRRPVMMAWASFLSNETDANVIELRRSGA